MQLYSTESINYEYRKVFLNNLKDIGTILHFYKNALIESEFKKTNYIYLILEGIVQQHFLSPEGTEKVFLILSTGDIFGEITMFQKDYGKGITKAFTNVKVCKIERNIFENYLNENPFIYDSLLLMITTKFRILMAQIYDATYLDTKDKLLSLLKRLSVQKSTYPELKYRLDLTITHDEIAKMIGSTRSTVTKLLKILEEEGKIIRSGKQINLVDL